MEFWRKKKICAQEDLDPTEKAKLILQYWRQKNGGEATRQRILDAMNICGLKYAAYELKTKWEAEAVTRRPHTHDTGQDRLTLYVASNSNPPLTRVLSRQDIRDVVKILKVTEYEQLFDKLGLSDQDRKTATKHVKPKRYATLVLRGWLQKTGAEATTERMLNALESASLRHAAFKLAKKWVYES